MRLPKMVFNWSRFNRIKRFIIAWSGAAVLGLIAVILIYVFNAFSVRQRPELLYNLRLVVWTCVMILICASQFVHEMYRLYLVHAEGRKLKFWYFLRSWDIKVKHDWLQELIVRVGKDTLLEVNEDRERRRAINRFNRAFDPELKRLQQRFPVNSQEYQRITAVLGSDTDHETKYAVYNELINQAPPAASQGPSKREQKIHKLCEQLRGMTPAESESETTRVCQAALAQFPTNFDEARAMLVLAINKQREQNRIAERNRDKARA